MTICLNCIERCVFLTETRCVFCDVGTECVCNWHVTVGFRRLVAHHSVWTHKSASTRSIKLRSCGIIYEVGRGVYSSSYEVEKIRWDETHSIHHHIRATRGIRVGCGPTSGVTVSLPPPLSLSLPRMLP